MDKRSNREMIAELAHNDIKDASGIFCREKFKH